MPSVARKPKSAKRPALTLVRGNPALADDGHNSVWRWDRSISPDLLMLIALRDTLYPVPMKAGQLLVITADPTADRAAWIDDQQQIIRRFSRDDCPPLGVMAEQARQLREAGVLKPLALRDECLLAHLLFTFKSYRGNA